MNKLMLATAVVTALASGSLMAKEWKEVRIGVEGAYPPFSWTEPSGEVIGFDIDIANALCEEMKVKCTLVKQDWDGIIPALLSRKFDAIIATMDITEERKKKVDFTQKYQHIVDTARLQIEISFIGGAVTLDGGVGEVVGNKGIHGGRTLHRDGLAFHKGFVELHISALLGGKAGRNVLVLLGEVHLLLALFCDIHGGDDGVKLA